MSHQSALDILAQVESTLKSVEYFLTDEPEYNRSLAKRSVTEAANQLAHLKWELERETSVTKVTKTYPKWGKPMVQWQRMTKIMALKDRAGTLANYETAPIPALGDEQLKYLAYYTTDKHSSTDAKAVTEDDVELELESWDVICLDFVNGETDDVK